MQKKQIAIFPLNTVLYPGHTIEIKIFEERYQQLLQDCLENNNRFGVCLIKEGMEAHGPLPEPSSVGTIAQIIKIKEMSSGIFQLSCQGEKRFQIENLFTNSGKNFGQYLMAEIKYKSFIKYDYDYFKKNREDLVHLIYEYVEKSTGRSTAHIEKNNLPKEPENIAYLAANLLQLPLGDRQVFLEIDDMDYLYKSIIKLYREQIYLVQVLLKKAKGMGNQLNQHNN